MKITSFLLFLVFSLQVVAQNVQNTEKPQKTYETKFVDRAPKIDGVLDDAAWQDANIATDFVMFRPTSGLPEPENLKSEVKIVYDNEAIYFGAYLHDDKPNEIPMEFQTRDNFGSADFFGIVLNPLNDGINQTEFFVMSTGNQNDCKVLPSGQEDWSWNAVWYSDVKLVNDGWIVEVKIPYSALRFSNESIQTWSMNFHRRQEKTRDQYSWNFIPRDQGTIAKFDGLLTGIENIKPPTRLSFSPYGSASLDEYEGDYDFGWSAGMDLKYGISENFTLDATLIPDFGQVAFDDLVLNLGPFEHRYSEKRAFFTEGVDLFSKADFFYSRRVGNTPLGYEDIEEMEDIEIVENPFKVDMLNAIKVSGRTKGGLGIGVFNAITEKTKATIRDIGAEESREIVTEPFANYNVLVFDQQFNKNSFITLLNTNVFRDGSFRDSNVTALLLDLKTKNSKYGVSGGVAMSNINENQEMTSGYEAVLEIGKVSGKHQFDVEVAFRDSNYDKNDLGYQARNNYLNFETSYSYRIYEPIGKFNRYSLYTWYDANFINELDKSLPSYQAKSNRYAGSNIGFNINATTKKELSFGGNVNSGIGQQYDYYEPRVEGRFYKKNPFTGSNLWISTDYRKTLALDLAAFHGRRHNDTNTYTALSVAPRYRINNNITLLYDFELDIENDEKGYVTLDDDENIIFGNRDILRVVNSVATKYNFNTKSSVGLTFRHYWSPVDYDDNFYLLQHDGLLVDNSYSNNEDLNYNIWNFDLNYSLEFAPGSQISLLYRNSIFAEGVNPDISFTSNIKEMFNEPLYNQLSLKLIYYLDYNRLKRS